MRSIGDILLDHYGLSTEQLERALRLQPHGRERLGTILVKLGLVPEQNLAAALAEQFGLARVREQDYPPVAVLDDQVSTAFLRDHGVLPLEEADDHVLIAVSDPADDFVAASLRLCTGKRIERRVDTPSAIAAAYERLYGAGKSAMGRIVDGLSANDGSATDSGDQSDIETLKDQASGAPVIRLVNLVLDQAVASHASDIHIEPFADQLTVRLRVDGVLRAIESPPRHLSGAVISRIKLMAGLDVAERRLPQDGRIKLRVRAHEIDLRVSTMPTLYGESVVMRLLDEGGLDPDFTKLGFSTAQRRLLEELLTLPHGIVLVTGPTGSGKSTTLYAALHGLNTPERKILTVEDPIEYQLAGINQVQVHPQIGLSFANALRALVRQDPDIIMVGEIRDAETAHIAIQSALTGHLVLSTLHTNDAPSSITRLLDMGVEDYLVTSTVNGILAQRLLRTLCRHCKQPDPEAPALIEKFKLQRLCQDQGKDQNQTPQVCRPVGCDRCGGSGYLGRCAIMEALVLNARLRRHILHHAAAEELREVALEEGMEPLFVAGLRQVTAGVTDLTELMRVTREAVA